MTNKRCQKPPAAPAALPARLGSLPGSLSGCRLLHKGGLKEAGGRNGGKKRRSGDVSILQDERVDTPVSSKHPPRMKEWRHQQPQTTLQESGIEDAIKEHPPSTSTRDVSNNQQYSKCSSYFFSRTQRWKNDLQLKCSTCAEGHGFMSTCGNHFYPTGSARCNFIQR